MAKKPYWRPLYNQRRLKTSLPVAKAHKEYQEFIKKELTLRRIEIPFIFFYTYPENQPPNLCSIPP